MTLIKSSCLFRPTHRMERMERTGSSVIRMIRLPGHHQTSTTTVFCKDINTGTQFREPFDMCGKDRPNHILCGCSLFVDKSHLDVRRNSASEPSTERPGTNLQHCAPYVTCLTSTHAQQPRILLERPQIVMPMLKRMLSVAARKVSRERTLVVCLS